MRISQLFDPDNDKPYAWKHTYVMCVIGQHMKRYQIIQQTAPAPVRELKKKYAN